MLFNHVAPRILDGHALREGPTLVSQCRRDPILLSLRQMLARESSSHLPPDCSPAQKYAHAPTTTATLLPLVPIGAARVPSRGDTSRCAVSISCPRVNLSLHARVRGTICRATVPFPVPFLIRCDFNGRRSLSSSPTIARCKRPRK